MTRETALLMAVLWSFSSSISAEKHNMIFDRHCPEINFDSLVLPTMSAFLS